MKSFPPALNSLHPFLVTLSKCLHCPARETNWRPHSMSTDKRLVKNSNMRRTAMRSLKNGSNLSLKMILTAVFSIIFLSGSVFTFWAGNLIVNLTPSMPLGIWSVEYLASDAVIPNGSVILFCPPDNKVFQEARAKGILHSGRCKGSYTPLLKEVLGVAGDVVEYRDGYFINGHEVNNSKILPINLSELSSLHPKEMILRPGEIWVMSTYSPLSFDSRYFGVVDRSSVLGIARPIAEKYD
ncbi:MAG: conjugative transfer signal peptidase TraF [Proteobacteria bacterium]|nr:MAG: conjugative transfer signal peptidase TraF [Pseudomonadota bacterium]